MYEANFELNTKSVQANLILNVMPDRTSQLINDSDYTTNAALSILDEKIDTKYDASNPDGYITNSAIGDGTITFTQGGVTKGTITTNQSGNSTIEFDAGSGITIDSELSTTSTNPVQNKVITTELNKKIEGITSSDVTTALGYTPYNAANPNGYQANKIETIKVNGTTQTITSKTVDITVPTNNNQLTNGAGYITGITSSDVTIALGYTPYDSSNPSGYTSNVGTVTSVNNVNPVNGNVTLSIPSAVTESTVSDWGFTKNAGTVTSVNNVSPVNGNVSITIPTVPTIATSVSASSTNAETVGAKLFYDTVGDIESALNTINSGS